MLIIVALLGGATVSIALSATRVFETTTFESELDLRAQRSLDRIVEELMSAPIDSMGAFPQTPSWQDSVEFDQVVAVNDFDAAMTFRTVGIQLMRDASDADDGTDNNANGLVDEGSVVLVRDPLGTPVTVNLCSMVSEYLEGETSNGIDDNGNGLVDERGFCIERTGNTLTLRLTLGRTDANGELVERTVETSIAPRN